MISALTRPRVGQFVARLTPLYDNGAETPAGLSSPTGWTPPVLAGQGVRAEGVGDDPTRGRSPHSLSKRRPAPTIGWPIRKPGSTQVPTPPDVCYSGSLGTRTPTTFAIVLAFKASSSSSRMTSVSGREADRTPKGSYSSPLFESGAVANHRLALPYPWIFTPRPTPIFQPRPRPWFRPGRALWSGRPRTRIATSYLTAPLSRRASRLES